MDKHHRRQINGRLTYQWRKIDILVLRDRLVELPYLLRFRPVTTHFWLDCVFVVLLVTIQTGIFPTATFGYLYLDLLTPWLVYTSVRTNGLHAGALAVLGAMVLETHSMAPKGLYLCIYTALTLIVVAIKEPLSWRHGTPWAVTLALCLTAVALVEYLTHAIIRGSLEASLSHYIDLVARLFLSWLASIYMVEYYLSREEYEEIG